VKGKPGPVPGTGKGNPFGIPTILYSTDKQKYQRLWTRCKKHGIKYEEALAMEGKTKLVGRHAKKMGRPPLATTPAKEPSRNKDGSLPASAAHDKIRELVAVKNGELRAGRHIKHNGHGRPRSLARKGRSSRSARMGGSSLTSGRPPPGWLLIS
jgi:hypothetical protein